MKKLSQNGFTVIEGVLIFVIFGIFSFVGWYVYSQSQKQDETSKPQSGTNSPYNQTEDIAFIPENDFSEEEIKEITEKVAGPLLFYNEKSLKFTDIRVSIKKSKNMMNGNDYRYILSSTQGGKPYESFVFGDNKIVSYWTPQLCDDGGCAEYPANFKKEYPKNYEAYICSQDTSKTKEELNKCGY